MKLQERRQLRQLAARLRKLTEDMVKFEASVLKGADSLHKELHKDH